MKKDAELQRNGSGNDGRKAPRPIFERTKKFALRIVRLYSALPKSTEAQVLGKQILRSGTSVGAHCREAYRSRSHPEFVSKLNGALMELEETAYWLELLTDAKIIPETRLGDLRGETDELTAILVASVKTATRRKMMNDERISE